MHADSLLELAAATAPLQQTVTAVQAALGSTENGEPIAVDDRIKTVMGQEYPSLAPGQQWPMSNNRSATRLSALEPRVDQLEAGLQTIQLTPGPAGADGATGPKGNTGAKGATGEVGPQGVAGPSGAAGPQGPAGAKGDTGAAGPQGVAGATGAAGPKGDTGAQGAVGQAGAQGPKGDAGVAGAQGVAGPKGDAGAVGAQGPAGATGADLTNPRIRTKRVATPAMLIGANPTVSVVWDTPFADNNYTLVPGLETANAGLLGKVPTITAKDRFGATVTIAVLLNLAAGAATVHFTAIHD